MSKIKRPCAGIILLVLLGLILNGESTTTDTKFLENVEKLETQSEIQNDVVVELSSCLSVQWSDNNCQIGPVSTKADIAEDVFNQLCPRSTGKYEAPSSCDLYIICQGESLTVNRCPPSYHFSSKAQTCVDAQTYECSHPVVSDPNTILSHTGTKKQRLSDESKSGRMKRSLISYVDDFANPNSQSRVENSHIMKKRGIKSNGDCPEDYVRPHPGSCNKFLICSNGKFFEQVCGVGTKFNPLSRVCDQSDNVDCTSKIADLGTYDCQKNYVYITSHFEYCNKFIECDHGELFVKTCPTSTVFNVETSRCDFAHKTPCNKPVSLEHDTDVNYLREPRDVSKYVCEFNYIAPIEGVCNEFLECEGSQLFRKSCGPGTAYNVLLGQCDWPYKVRAPDAQYCSRYLQCDGKHYQPKECPKSTFYNVGTGRCEPIENVDCNGKLDDPRLPSPQPSTVRPSPRTRKPLINSK